MILTHRYLLFVYDYHDGGGWGDFVDSNDNAKVLMDSLDYHIKNAPYAIVSHAAHIVDLTTHKVAYRHSWLVGHSGWHAVDGLDDDPRF